MTEYAWIQAHDPNPSTTPLMPAHPTSEAALASALIKATRTLVPFLLLLYVLAFLDRVNVGFAKVAMMADTGLSAAAYAFGAGLFFAGYALLEVPSNLILHRIGARRWLARIMVTWGLISAAIQSYDWLKKSWLFGGVSQLPVGNAQIGAEDKNETADIGS